MKYIKYITVFLVCTFYTICFAQPDLAQYLRNDLELQRLALEVKKNELSLQKTAIDKGISVQLSTGTATFTNQNDSFNISFTPSASVSILPLSNLKAAVSSSIKIDDGRNNSENLRFSLSADIISATAAERKLSLMNAERMLLSAKRALQNRALEAEKEYYAELRRLFMSEIDIIQAQKNLYENKIKFEEIKAKGYTTTSSKYRQTELNVLSNEHTVEIKKRKQQHDCAVFAAKCGIGLKKDDTVKSFLPQNIQNVEAVDIDSFKKELYKKTEQAEWTRIYNTLARKAGKNFTLSASTGYTIQNPGTLSGSSKKSDTADMGINAVWYGLNFGAGVSLPIEQNAHPIYTLSASIDPNEFKKASINTQQNAYSEEEELIALKSAADDYNTVVIAQKRSLADIHWSKQNNTQTYLLYENLEKDMSEHFKSGIITESEYLNTYANKEQYRIQLLINDIDLILYNNTTKLLFCRDDEIL